MPRPSDTTELNNGGMIKLGNIHYQQNRIYHFFPKTDLISIDSSFCSQILLTTDLQCHVFPFGKLLLNVHLCL